MSTNLTSKKSTNNEYLGNPNSYNDYTKLSTKQKTDVNSDKTTKQKSSTKKIPETSEPDNKENENFFTSLFDKMTSSDKDKEISTKLVDNKTSNNESQLSSLFDFGKETLTKAISQKDSTKSSNKLSNSDLSKPLTSDKKATETSQPIETKSESTDAKKDSTKETVEKIAKSIPSEGFNWNLLIIWVLVIILLSFFGFNIFNIFGDIIGNISNILKPIFSLFGLATLNLTSDTVDVLTEGGKDVVNTSSNILDSGLNLVNNTSQSGLSLLKQGLESNNNKTKNDEEDEEDDEDNNQTDGIMDTYNLKDVDKLAKFIDDNFDNKNTFNSYNRKSCKANCKIKCRNDSGSDQCSTHCDKYCDEVINDPTPTIANSRVQSNRASGKSGFCYIGEEEGIRSCVKVSEHDICTSGKIYSSKAICQNPILRK